MADNVDADLARDLETLGRGLNLPAPSDRLSTSVLERVASLPAPAPVTTWTGWWRRAAQQMTQSVASRRRRILAVVLAVLLALLAAPPVRAAVADWFGFGGVRVERGAPPPGAASSPPQVTQHGSVAQAAAAVGFPISLPRDVGAPDGVQVAPDRRVVSMSWTSGRDGDLRLDQFDASLDFSMLKRTPRVQFTQVDGSDAMWFEEPHEVVLLASDGSRRTESARLAGHTLVWLKGDTTLRLEGDVTLERAIQIAESTMPVE